MEKVYNNKYFNIVKVNNYHFINEPFSENSAAVLIKHKSKGFVLIDIFRQSLNKNVLEIPRGNANIGESSIDCAYREVAEETGYIIKKDKIKKLGSINPNSGILSSTIDLFYAEVDNEPMVETDNEANKNIYISYDELVNSIKSGIIKDSFTLAAFTLYSLQSST